MINTPCYVKHDPNLAIIAKYSVKTIWKSQFLTPLCIMF